MADVEIGNKGYDLNPDEAKRVVQWLDSLRKTHGNEISFSEGAALHSFLEYRRALPGIDYVDQLTGIRSHKKEAELVQEITYFKRNIPVATTVEVPVLKIEESYLLDRHLSILLAPKGVQSVVRFNPSGKSSLVQEATEPPEIIYLSGITLKECSVEKVLPSEAALDNGTGISVYLQAAGLGAVDEKLEEYQGSLYYLKYANGKTTKHPPRELGSNNWYFDSSLASRIRSLIREDVTEVYDSILSAQRIEHANCLNAYTRALLELRACRQRLRDLETPELKGALMSIDEALTPFMKFKGGLRQAFHKLIRQVLTESAATRLIWMMRDDTDARHVKRMAEVIDHNLDVRAQRKEAQDASKNKEGD